jgi:hypothetical protein
MVTTELIDYIKNSLEKGVSVDELRAKLTNRGGWTMSDISAALATINKSESLPVKTLTAKPVHRQAISPIQNRPVMQKPTDQRFLHKENNQTRGIQRPQTAAVKEHNYEKEPEVTHQKNHEKESDHQGLALLCTCAALILAGLWIYNDYKSPVEKNTETKQASKNTLPNTAKAIGTQTETIPPRPTDPRDITAQSLLEYAVNAATAYVQTGKALTDLCMDTGIIATQNTFTTSMSTKKTKTQAAVIRKIECNSDEANWRLIAVAADDAFLCVDNTGDKVKTATEPEKDSVRCR